MFASPDFRVSVMLNPQIALIVALPRNVPAFKITAKPCLRLDICEGSKRSQTAIDWPNLTRRDHHPYSKADYVALQLNRCRTVPALEALKIRLSFCRGCELRFDSTTAEWVKPKRHRGVFVAPNQRRCDHVQRPRRDHRPVSDRAPVHVGVDEKVHEPTKLAAVFDTLVSQGFAAEEILRSVDITPERVHSPKTQISLRQLATARAQSRPRSKTPDQRAAAKVFIAGGRCRPG